MEKPILRAQIFYMIEQERKRQEELHPNTPNNDQFLLSVLVEEVGEVAKAIQENSNLEEELIHVASVCLRWLENRNA